jgi:hypothetical protein
VKISKPSLRATATRVVPAASAVRTARAVGADTAPIAVASSTTAFCTIFDRHTAGEENNTPLHLNIAAGERPASLSSALCRPTSSRRTSRPRSGDQNAAACTARVCRLIGSGWHFDYVVRLCHIAASDAVKRRAMAHAARSIEAALEPAADRSTMMLCFYNRDRSQVKGTPPTSAEHIPSGRRSLVVAGQNVNCGLG